MIVVVSDCLHLMATQLTRKGSVGFYFENELDFLMFL